MKLLITGGAGYIGSHMVRHAQNKGHDVVVLDNFSTGNIWSVSDCEIIEADLLDYEKIKNKINNSFDGVIHFAAKSLVAESVKLPNLYYRNNVIGTMNLIDVMLKNNIENLIFSSSASIFGHPISKNIDEHHPKKPINAYGRSKLIIEQMLKDISSAYQLNATCLRYFNAAGADPNGSIGESREIETHLIPNILKSCLHGNNRFKIFGNDYDTFDGTCIRDYVHVNDLAHAHLLSIENLKNNKGCFAYNLGNGDGYSVLDVLNSCQKITGQEIIYDIERRRNGDPSRLVADSSLAKKELGWIPAFDNIEEIINTAWMWHKSEFLKKN